MFTGARARRSVQRLQQQEARDERVDDGEQTATAAATATATATATAAATATATATAAAAQVPEGRGQIEQGQARAEVDQPTGPEEPVGDATAADGPVADVEVRVQSPVRGGQTPPVLPEETADDGSRVRGRAVPDAGRAQDQDGAAHTAHPAKVGQLTCTACVVTLRLNNYYNRVYFRRVFRLLCITTTLFFPAFFW